MSSKTPTFGPLISFDGILTLSFSPLIKIISLVGDEKDFISLYFTLSSLSDFLIFSSISSLALICKFGGISSLYKF